MSQGNGTPPSDALELIRKELKDLTISQGKIKLREWSDLEDKTGQQCNPWIGRDDPPFWFMQGVLWLWLRRTHPQLTFEDFGELDLEDLQKARGGEDDLDPTSAPPEPSGDEPTLRSSPASAISSG